ncbi:CLUMA_CG015506, isoform A [Clunio marinus]|uniref:CLUMA_CG015506, isoform A n=1 Tax=Clunio marinus TaxID=568069 RepID=A0A1J1IQL9_9DIPT|nr:CLUMA_CG015506, isoform A [Clunio marinus]
MRVFENGKWNEFINSHLTIFSVIKLSFQLWVKHLKDEKRRCVTVVKALFHFKNVDFGLRQHFMSDKHLTLRLLYVKADFPHSFILV